jgi:hypothetical protein
MRGVANLWVKSRLISFDDVFPLEVAFPLIIETIVALALLFLSSPTAHPSSKTF